MRRRDLRTKSTASYWAAHHWPDMAANPDFEALELDDGGVRKFKWAAWRAVEGLWDLEDPTAIHVDDTETEVRSEVGGVPFLGYVDRIDEGDGDGEIIVDYKSGRLPSGRYLDTPKQQVLLYAAAREHQGHDVAEARLLYLGKATVKVPAPAEALQAVSEYFYETWDAIQGTISEGTFLPRPRQPVLPLPLPLLLPGGDGPRGGSVTWPIC